MYFASVLRVLTGLHRVAVRLALSETIHEGVCDAGKVLAGIFLRQFLRDLSSHIADPKTQHLALTRNESSQEFQRVAASDENFAAFTRF